MTVWQVLGLAPDAERDAIRRAYAKKLRVTNPEDDPEAFKVLREAYEQALAQAEHRAMWAAYEAEDDAGEDEEWREPDAPPARPGWQAVPQTASDETPEAAAFHAVREAELETLRTHMAALEAGLRGPWRADDAELDRRLRVLLDTEAMGDLAIRDDVEPWLAELIADTTPASDAILREAIEAFGWDDGRVRHHAVYRVLERLQEWRTIAVLNQSGHIYHAGWKSLTGAPRNDFLWRFDALRPSVRRGAEALLGGFGEESPGLHYSFNTASADRWTAFHAQARLTLGMLCQVPVLLVAFWWLVRIVSGREPTLLEIGIGALLACAAPVVTLKVFAPLRERWRARDHASAAIDEGWLPAYVAALVLAGLLPGLWPLALAPVALGIAIWAFVVRGTGPSEPVKLGMVGWLFMLGAVATVPISDVMSGAETFALAVAAALFLQLRVHHRREASQIVAWRIERHGAWWLLGATALVIAAGFVIDGVRTGWHPTVTFYPVTLCVLAAMLPANTVTRAYGWARWLAAALIGLAFVVAGTISLPPERQSGPRTETSVPIAEDTAGRALAAMEEAQPAFAGVRTGNPALYAELRGDLEKFYAGTATRAEAMAAFGRRVDAAYQARLPETSTDLLLEGQRVHLAVLRALRPRDSVACAEEGTKPYDPTLLTQAQQDRQTAQVYNVLANPPVPRAQQGNATPVSSDLLLTRVAALLDLDRATAAARLTGKGSPRERCDARIAMISVLVDLPPDGVAAMLRRELRRQRGR